MSTVIKAENISKKYILSHQKKEGYLTFRDLLANKAGKAFKAISRKNGPQLNPEKEEFWALKDLNFDIKQGERVGIIGKNGAGKSTLLKILSRIVEPTTGAIGIKGRAASLLEVGTGFHPELTGRENVFLNGAILGMRKTEIAKKFDEIVAFAEIEKFLDTPVKRYSSGMYVRLAFAVAAHLEPEILILDEVLAVGDAAFQKKCLGKMEEVSKGEGRTVLFVSHNMAAVKSFCNRGILLKSGSIIADGTIDTTVDQYLSMNSSNEDNDLTTRKDRAGTGELRYESYYFKNSAGERVTALQTGDCGYLVLRGRSEHDLTGRILFDVGVEDIYGARITRLSNNLTGDEITKIEKGVFEVNIKFNKLPLVHGRYFLTLFSSVNKDVADWIKNAGHFDIEAGDYFGTGQINEGQGNFVVEHSYTVTNERE